jgi:hypothetical protein
MRYATLTLLSSLSTALLAATSLLWLRSHTLTNDTFWHTDSAPGLTRSTRFRTSGGGLWFETRTHRATRPRHSRC